MLGLGHQAGALGPALFNHAGDNPPERSLTKLSWLITPRHPIIQGGYWPQSVSSLVVSKSSKMMQDAGMERSARFAMFTVLTAEALIQG